MTDIKIIDARGLSCPQPVVLTKQALEANARVTTIVDNETALENVKRLAGKFGCDLTVEPEDKNIHKIHITRGADFNKDQPFAASCETGVASSGPFVIAVTEDKMGRGDDDLGTVLMKAFIHTVAGQAKKPGVIIFYNTGVKLTVQGADVLEDLKQLESEGVQILVCGTCLNYFEINDKHAVGVVSNMYDIVETMSQAGRLLTP
ncbi:MAG: sulfurtransferase-like selenium metabolism protein YedF [Smithella sp.]|jgi:selenium metabolism protein YedF|nr:sulfurtransferase-like selenium metabolism protein YedF [Smithella sp.]